MLQIILLPITCVLLAFLKHHKSNDWKRCFFFIDYKRLVLEKRDWQNCNPIHEILNDIVCFQRLLPRMVNLGVGLVLMIA
jgi:hypothetical protein